MAKQLIRVGLVLVAILVAAIVACSCGTTTGLGLRFGDTYWRDDFYLRDGDRRDDYIYYNGSWHYRGFGTPYYWDYYYF